MSARVPPLEECRVAHPDLPGARRDPPVAEEELKVREQSIGERASKHLALVYQASRRDVKR